jgi:hypothetical protein
VIINLSRAYHAALCAENPAVAAEYSFGTLWEDMLNGMPGRGPDRHSALLFAVIHPDSPCDTEWGEVG